MVFVVSLVGLIFFFFIFGEGISFFCFVVELGIGFLGEVGGLVFFSGYLFFSFINGSVSVTRDVRGCL